MRRDPNRSSHIALVAGARGKRWILATENMTAGDVISTFGHIPDNPIIGLEGNAHPIGAMSDGTLVNCVERWPAPNAKVFQTIAGQCAQIIRRQGDHIVIRVSRNFIYWQRVKIESLYFSCHINTNMRCIKLVWQQSADFRMAIFTRKFTARLKCIDALVIDRLAAFGTEKPVGKSRQLIIFEKKNVKFLFIMSYFGENKT